MWDRHYNSGNSIRPAVQGLSSCFPSWTAKASVNILALPGWNPCFLKRPCKLLGALCFNVGIFFVGSLFFLKIFFHFIHILMWNVYIYMSCLLAYTIGSVFIIPLCVVSIDRKPTVCLLTSSLFQIRILLNSIYIYISTSVFLYSVTKNNPYIYK